MNSKKQRKFRVWDNRLIYETLQKTTQIANTVEAKCVEGVTPQDLPQSIVPTDILYDLCMCYQALYDKLETEELLQSGYPKGRPTTH